MKRKLWLKLTGSFAVLILSGSIIIAVIINIATANYYNSLINNNDMNLARELSLEIGLYNEVLGSWEGIGEVLSNFPFGQNMMAMHMRNMQPHSMTRSEIFPRIVLTDTENIIIVDTEENGSLELSDTNKQGLPVYANKQLVGFLYVGSMIKPGLKPLEESFLRSVNFAIILTTVIIIVIALILGTFLISQITSPLKELTVAAENIAEGNLNVRVKISNKDELGEMAGSFNLMVESLLRTEEWKQQLISNSAHELRTPVSLIQGYLEMMIEGVYELNKENINSIYEESKRLTRLISELQSLSNADSGILILKKEDKDIIEIAKHSIEIFQPLADEKGIKLLIRTENKELFANVDIQKIQQVFSNLFSNAIHYSPDNSTIEIYLAGFSNAGYKKYIKVCIKDYGLGIPDSELEKVFERFHRIDSSRNRESGGSGLGLSISQEIIRLHSGKIWIESEYKTGACFCFTLPSIK